MRRMAAVALVCLLIAALAPTSDTEEARLALARGRVDSADQAAFLLTHFDETHNHHHGFVELLLWPGDKERLRAAGIDYEVVVEDVVARDLADASTPSEAVTMPGPDRKDYRRLSGYVSEMRKLARKHPSLVRVMKLHHKTLEERSVFGYRDLSAGASRRWQADVLRRRRPSCARVAGRRIPDDLRPLPRRTFRAQPPSHLYAEAPSRHDRAGRQRGWIRFARVPRRRPGSGDVPAVGRGSGDVLAKEPPVCIRSDGAGCTQEPGCVRSRPQPQLLVRVGRRWGRFLRDSRRPDLQRGRAVLGAGDPQHPRARPRQARDRRDH
jgi:hypothetical protein